jgi:hypothetical protein
MRRIGACSLLASLAFVAGLFFVCVLDAAVAAKPLDTEFAKAVSSVFVCEEG